MTKVCLIIIRNRNLIHTCHIMSYHVMLSHFILQRIAKCAIGSPLNWRLYHTHRWCSFWRSRGRGREGGRHRGIAAERHFVSGTKLIRQARGRGCIQSRSWRGRRGRLSVNSDNDLMRAKYGIDRMDGLKKWKKKNVSRNCGIYA